MEILIGALVVAAFFTVVVSLVQGERAIGALTFFFLLFFLPIWALSLWIPAVGPVWYGIAWVDLMIIAALLTLLFMAASPGSRYRKRLLETRRPTEADQHVQVMQRYSAAFWAFISLMILAILFGTVAKAESMHVEAKQKQQSNDPVILVTTVEVAQGSGCWATLYDRNHFEGEQITIYNGVDLPEMKFANGTNWQGRVQSVRVGPGAELILYGAPFWGDQDYLMGPGAQIAIMNNLPWNAVESLRLQCIGEEE